MSHRQTNQSSSSSSQNQASPARKLNVLIGCEFSGIVREAFRALGHNAYSCDILPAEDGSEFHIQADVLDLINQVRFEGAMNMIDTHVVPFWDLAIFHPPCTRLTVAGARWFKGREDEQREAIQFCEKLWQSRIPRIALENPVGVLSTKSILGKPAQIVQPWMFGHGETKATCLWLKGLKPLEPTNIVEGRTPRVHHEPPSPDRWKNRSRTYPGLAAAMAQQWGMA